MTTRILISHVKRATCLVYGVSTADLEGSDRHRRFVEPRHMAMAVAKKLTEQSWANIARAFARTDADVIYATRKVESRTLKSERDYETYFEISRLARAYAAGETPSPQVNRSLDMGSAYADQIRSMSDRAPTLSPWTIANRLGLPVSEVNAVLGVAR